jgi:regulatory protein
MRLLNFNELYAYALDVLSRREISQKSLLRRLIAKGGAEFADQVIERLLSKGWLSDRRFSECYLRARTNRGFGPLAIKQKLQLEGVPSSLIAEIIEESEINWQAELDKLIAKKLSKSFSSSPQAKEKLARFLISRGFLPSMVYSALKN